MNEMIENILRGHCIVKVVRDVYFDEYQAMPFDLRDEEADGQTSFLMDDNSEIYFTPNSENMSVNICTGRMNILGEGYKRVDVSGNTFWAKRINVKIVSLVELYHEDSNVPFGIKFTLYNGICFSVKYLSDESHVDSLIVTE